MVIALLPIVKSLLYIRLVIVCSVSISSFVDRKSFTTTLTNEPVATSLPWTTPEVTCAVNPGSVSP
jgi:hypothetical protein